MELPERNLGFLLHDVARLMRKRFEQNARGIGLTRSQCQVLAHLARNEGIQQSGLADILEIEPITLTRLLDRLEEGGLVERRAHPTDRRIRQLFLTDKVHPLLADIFAIGAATRGEALEGVAQEDRQRLFELLSSMKANLLGRTTPAAGERSKSNG
jgi:DNA-binding MarR family transcriptional regulator